MLTLEGIGKHYLAARGEIVVLRDLSLSLRRGESAAVMGPSGSGKSTLLNILGTLEPPSKGRMTIDDVDPFQLPEREIAAFRNRKLGFVFQDHHLLPQCSVLENVLLPALAARRGESLLARATELLERVGLSDRLEHRPAELSGGERQRVAVARALINRPPLILADEPTGNLDRASAETVADLLLQLPEKDDALLLVVTHSHSLAERFRRRFDLIDGKLVPR